MDHLKAIILLLLLASNFVYSQDNCTLQVTGRIFDEHDDSSLPYANIYLMENNKGAGSDSTGYYSIKNLCPGTYTFRVSHIGCETQFHIIKITSDTIIQFIMEHHEELLESITVKDKRENVPVTESSSSISGAALSKQTGKALGQTLAEITGVETIKTGPNIFKPIIHGMYGSRIPIYNQGLKLEGQEWGTDHAPEVDPYSAGSISIIKGASAVRYGIGTVGGAVLLNESETRIDPGIGGEFNVASMSNGKGVSSSISLNGKLEKAPEWSWKTQASFRKSGDFNAPDYSLTNTGFQDFGGTTQIKYQVPNWQAEIFYSAFSSEMGILRSSHIGNLTDLEIALQSEVPLFVEDFSYDILNPKQKVFHHLLKARLLHLETKLGTWEWIYGLQLNLRKEFDIRRGDRSDIPSLDMELTTNSAEITLKHNPWFEKNTGEIGIQSSFQTNRNVPGTGVKPLIPWYNSITTGLFLIEKINGDPFTFETGIRFDFRKLLVKRFDQNNQLVRENQDFGGFSSTFAMNYKTGSLHFVSQVGYTFRPPNISELYSEGLHHAVAAIEQGNTNLSNERSLKWINSFHYESETMIHTGVDIYMQRFWDYIYLRPDAEPQLTIRGAFPVFNYVQTDARLFGIDLHFHYELFHDFILTTKGSLLSARDISLDEDLYLMPADNLELGLSYVIHGRYQLKDLQFSVSSKHKAKQSRFPADIDYTPPPEGYSLLNFETSVRWAFSKNEIYIHFKIENLLDKAYRDYLNRLRYYATEMGRNFELRLNYKF